MLLPLWTKELKLTPSALDPLGLSRVSEHIVWNLLPGITVMTNRGRNYGFYCWAVARALEEADNTPLFTQVAQYEAAYVIGSLLDAEDNFPGAKGPIGNNRGVEAIRKSRSEENNLAPVDFSVLRHPSGGFKQYYQSSMERLGLVLEDSTRVILYNREKNGRCFSEKQRDTEYLRENLGKTAID